MTGTTDPLCLRLEIEAFLYREAALLDGREFDRWLGLFTEDATYWVPSVPEQSDPLEHASIIYEDTTVLALRIERLTHPRAHAVTPAPRTVHTVSNVLIESDLAAPNHGDELAVGSTLLMVEYREQRQRLFAARVRHRLRRVDEQWRIGAKRVDLIDCDGVLPVMSVPF